MTLDEIIQRMRDGERLRWIANEELHGDETYNPGRRNLWIGKTMVRPEVVAAEVIDDKRVRELPGNEKNDQPYIDYELVEGM
jgi:hypothetical protein